MLDNDIEVLLVPLSIPLYAGVLFQLIYEHLG